MQEERQQMRKDVLRRVKMELQRKGEDVHIKLDQLQAQKNYLAMLPPNVEDMWAKMSFAKYEEKCLEYDNFLRETLVHNHRCKQVEAEDASPLNHSPVLLDRYALVELLSTKSNQGGIEHWVAEDLVKKTKVSLKISTNQKLLCLEHAPYKLYKNINIIGTDQDIIEVSPSQGMPTLYLFTLDYIERDLQTILYASEAKNGQLPAFQAREIAFRLCHALHYLHDEEKVAHCDIRPANILVSASMDVRLTGLKSLQNRRNAIRHIKPHEVQLMDSRRLMYCAPEYFGEWTFPANNAAETTTFESADIWSLGILLYEMLYGLHPFLDAIFELNATDKIKYGELLALYREQNGPPIEFPSSPNTVPDFAKNFIKQCLAPNAFERPRALRLLERFV